MSCYLQNLALLWCKLCFLGTAQIPPALSEWTICTKRRRNKLQQLDTDTEQCTNYSSPVFQSTAPSLKSCALTWPFLNSSSLQNAEDQWAWALCLAVWEKDGWVPSTGCFQVTNVFWRIYLYLGRDSVLLVPQKRRRREFKSTADLPKVGASCCPLQVQVTKPVLSHRLKNHIVRCVCLLLKGCCGENPLHHALAYPCWWQAIALNFSELIQVKTK